MDVNQTRFHLLHGPADWGACHVNGSEQTLSDLWREHRDPPLEWHPASNTLRLARALPWWRGYRGRRTPPLDLASRRGAARDRYGNWYWINEEETGIRFLPRGARRSVAWWGVADLDAACAAADPGDFAPTASPAPRPGRLRGLAVTGRHFLVVGDEAAHGLWVFDLHGGGAPLLLRWPEEEPFTPWDMAATADGGLLVLDRDHRRYWRLDANLRLWAEMAAPEDAWFQPTSPTAPANRERRPALPHGYDLAAGPAPAPTSPVSIEAGHGDAVWILDTDPARPFSMVYEYRGSTQVAAYSLENAVTAVDPALGEGVTVQASLAAHDFVHLGGFLGAGEGAVDESRSVLYLAERDGNQVIAFAVDRSQGKLVDQQEFLPLRRWEAKALVAAGDGIYYDFADRWVSLQPVVECHYVGRGVLTTPVPSASAVPGAPFDSNLPGCTWHRLMLDAHIPAGAAILVRARAADDPELLRQSGWLAQPAPYLRSGGAELPYFDPWAAEPVDRERTGTWELLFQGVKGRYLQLELTLLGTGRSTPAVRSLRAWYPRFSYLEHYLPAIYREEPGPAAFLERWLANVEGFYTQLEDKIEHVAALFDPRTAPPEALDWLGCWLGLVLDPLWPTAKRRFFIRHAHRLYRRRGTVAGILAAIRLYLDEQVDESLFDLDCLARSRVRLVERFRTRDIGGTVFGDPGEGDPGGRRPVTAKDVAEAAHRFTVLLPHDLTAEQRAMVERIVGLAKPAHTAFELKQYWALFRVGEARLGLDTALGYGSRFEPAVLGDTYLADSYLAPPYPFDVPDRIVVARDRLGDLPTL
ncbi:MAG: phage tail protein [Caldilineales bacterium]|nr:phage tail protein [Caldilineales bacterium]